MRYRKKPEEIEAFQMTKERRWDNSEWPNWLNRAWQMGQHHYGAVWIDWNDSDREKLVCGTLKGVCRINWNDFIIQGQGELYPCKPDIFEKTYEPVED